MIVFFKKETNIKLYAKNVVAQHRPQADYIYRNKDDTIRFKIFQRQLGFWDADIWTKDGNVITYSVEAGETWKTKREMLQDIQEAYGILIPMGAISTVTEGWN